MSNPSLTFPLSTGTVPTLAPSGTATVGASVVNLPTDVMTNALSGIALAANQVPYGASGVTPVTGTFTATGQSASFDPLAGRKFNITLWGTFSATVQLERSFDGGTTWQYLTSGGTQTYKWTAIASEQNQEDEYIAIYRLNCTAFTSGTVNYRISQ